jgi:hypothetical protein
MMQMVELESLFREKQFSAGMAGNMRISGVNDLMGLQARVVVESCAKREWAGE